MGYRIIRPGTLTERQAEKIGISSRGYLIFNKKIQKTMGIKSDSRMGVYISEDGYLSFMALARDDFNGFPLKRFKKNSSCHLLSRELTAHCQPGRYVIERHDGDIFVSNCKWEDK